MLRRESNHQNVLGEQIKRGHPDDDCSSSAWNACKVIKEICDKSSLSWDCTNALKKLKQLLLDDTEPLVKEASLRACVALRNSRVDDFTERQEIERALLEATGMSPKTRKELERAFEGSGFVTTMTKTGKTDC